VTLTKTQLSALWPLQDEAEKEGEAFQKLNRFANETGGLRQAGWFCDSFRLRSEERPHNVDGKGSKIKVFTESGRSAVW
jgi:hypothetical protein